MTSVLDRYDKYLKWVPFLYSIFLFEFCIPLAALIYKVEFLRVHGKKNDLYGWAKGMKELFRYRCLKVGSRDLYRGKCVFLVNHRSWADFFIDGYLTEGRAVYFGRWAVVFAFPLFGISGLWLKSAIVFKRGVAIDKDKFNKMLDEKMADSPLDGILVYPEGHRNTLPKSLPLKRGMLNYTYSRKLPVQVVIASNKESVMSEKECTAHFGQTIAVGYSPLIQSSEFATFNEFAATVQSVWDEQWKEVYEADWTDLNELAPGRVDAIYPSDLLISHAVIVVLGILVLFAFVYGWWRAAGALLSLFGPLRHVVGLLVGGFVGVSFWHACEPQAAAGAPPPEVQMGTVNSAKKQS